MFLYLFYCIVFALDSIIEVNSKIFYNTYNVEISRSTIHQPYVIDKTCLLKPDVGPCRAEIEMYYYDPPTRNCSTFLWGGCQGNGNRFDSNSECRRSCLSSPDRPKARPKWCSLTFDYGFCFGALKRWHYDPLWKVCKQRIYSGCGGNKNNFYSKEQCDSICRLGTGSISATEKSKSGMKKILIRNPLGATSKKGSNQTLPKRTSNVTYGTPTIKNGIQTTNKIQFVRYFK